MRVTPDKKENIHNWGERFGLREREKGNERVREMGVAWSRERAMREKLAERMND